MGDATTVGDLWCHHDFHNFARDSVTLVRYATLSGKSSPIKVGAVRGNTDASGPLPNSAVKPCRRVASEKARPKHATESAKRVRGSWILPLWS